MMRSGRQVTDEQLDEIRDELRRRIEDVFTSNGAELRRFHRQWRTGTCPACGQRSRGDAVNVDLERGVWHCKYLPCGAGGDAIDALARFQGLDTRRDWPQVIELAADFAGVQLHDEPVDARTATERALEREQRRREREAERTRRAAVAAAAEAQAIERARGIWPRLARHDDRGERYLAGRGLAPALLIAAGAVRFMRDGSPAVALHNSAGELVNIVKRAIDGSEPKTPGLFGCPTPGTLVGKVPDIMAGAFVVVVEGVVDSMTAAEAWPRAVVLGAHSAGNYGDVARMAAERLHAVGGGRMALAIDRDRAGLIAGTAAADAIRGSGLDPARVDVLRLGSSHDLSDAYAAGWRP